MPKQISRVKCNVVERIVLNALLVIAALPPDICAFGQLPDIVLETRRSTLLLLRGLARNYLENG